MMERMDNRGQADEFTSILTASVVGAFFAFTLSFARTVLELVVPAVTLAAHAVTLPAKVLLEAVTMGEFVPAIVAIALMAAIAPSMFGDAPLLGKSSPGEEEAMGDSTPRKDPVESVQERYVSGEIGDYELELELEEVMFDTTETEAAA